MYTPSRRLSAASLACAAALLMAGCASDDEPVSSPSEPVASATPTPTPTPTLADFCQAKVAIDAAFLQEGPPEEEEGATPDPAKVGAQVKDTFGDLYANLVRTAQPEVADSVAKENDLLQAAISAGNADFTFSPDFGQAEAPIDEYLLDKCGYNKLSGTAVNYEYQGLPSVSPSGLTALTLTNSGTELHEMLLLRINDDVDLTAKEILALPEEEAMTKAVPMAVTVVPPGSTATNFFDLTSGRYAVLCFIPKGSTPPEFHGEGAPHFTLGMLEDLKVLGAGEEATAEPTTGSSMGHSMGGSSDDSSTEDSDSSTSDEDYSSSEPSSEPSATS